MKAAISPLVNLNSQRKADHIDISMEMDVAFDGVTTGFEQYSFIHEALPEVDLKAIDLSTSVFGKEIKAPIFISSMIGGIDRAEEINRNLAAAAQELGLPFGVGSQRCAIENPDTAVSYQVRDIAPDIPLFANIGAVQFNYEYGFKECNKAVEMIDADALILHLNPLQEALQKEGDTDFSGLAEKIESICNSIPVPVIAKEVSFGISERTARRLADAGVSAIDVAGAGGTSWSEVEKHRSPSQQHFNIAASFVSWGIPTADSIIMSKNGAPELPIFASGGIRTGLDVAKSVALGADMAGIALPLLKAAHESKEAVISALQEIIEGVRIAMFCIGAKSIDELKGSPKLKRNRGYHVI